jgi:uncharacterized membrane protein YkvA (DUF1232 family)
MQINPYKWYQRSLRAKGLKWIVIVATIVYIISPIDLLPEFIPGLGLIDDTMLIVILVSELVRMAREKKNGPKFQNKDEKN